MKFRTLLLLSALSALLWATPVAAAQQDALTLSVHRDFGYGGFDNQIQGRFSLRAQGPPNLQRVEFYLDGQLMATVSQEPFHFQFNTDSYPEGEHLFSAIGYTADGAQLHSNTVTRVFLSGAQANQMMVRIVGPILGISALVIVLTAALSLRSSRKPFDGTYGVLGGAVCPHCQLPYALHWLAPRLITRRLQRCPHCGKSAWVGRAKPADLQAAEARWRSQDAAGAPANDGQQRKQRQIEDSRYDS